ncbi:MAG: pseudouridine synthase [Clostridia bacterium]
MRINKYLADCGQGSRRACEKLILDGQVLVNGKIETNLATDIKLNDVVQCLGNIVAPSGDFLYYKLHKPKGVICSASDEKGRKTIFDLVNCERRLFSIGRLDYDTEGLILLTNDGQLAQKLSHPSHEIEKEYMVCVRGNMLESELAVLRAGVVENGIRMPSAKVVLIKTENNISRVSVKISQGLNRQVRRMFEAIGREILLLKRVAVGNVCLGGLQRGKCKQLSQTELAELFKLCENK